MKTVEKLAERQERLGGAAPVTIAFLGDSVTQGCFENFVIRENCVDTVFDPQSSYVTHVEQMLRFFQGKFQRDGKTQNGVLARFVAPLVHDFVPGLLADVCLFITFHVRHIFRVD